MKPRIFTTTICRNEDRVIGATLDAWEPFADTMYVIDTGSIDRTREAMFEPPRDDSKVYVNVCRAKTVGDAMTLRQLMINRVMQHECAWILTLDSDEVWAESQIRALLHRMEDPEIDFIAVRPVAIGQDCASMYAPHYFEPENLEDRVKFSTEHWCDKWSTRAYRASRCITVSDSRWGCEVFSVAMDSYRDKLTPDYKPEPVPEGHVSTMFTGRTAWTDIYFNHLTNFTRSSKWAEIEQVLGSNAMDRARWRRMGRRGRYPLPAHFEIPESVRRIAEGEEWA